MASWRRQYKHFHSCHLFILQTVLDCFQTPTGTWGCKSSMFFPCIYSLCPFSLHPCRIQDLSLESSHYFCCTFPKVYYVILLISLFFLLLYLYTTIGMKIISSNITGIIFCICISSVLNSCSCTSISISAGSPRSSTRLFQP